MRASTFIATFPSCSRGKLRINHWAADCSRTGVLLAADWTMGLNWGSSIQPPIYLDPHCSEILNTFVRCLAIYSHPINWHICQANDDNEALAYFPVSTIISSSNYGSFCVLYWYRIQNNLRCVRSITSCIHLIIYNCQSCSLAVWNYGFNSSFPIL